MACDDCDGSEKNHGDVVIFMVFIDDMVIFVNGKDDIPYMKWKIKNVPNHQPVM